MSNPSFSYRAELQRKGLHLLALILPLGLIWLGKTTALWILIPGSIIGLSADVLRHYSPAFQRFIERFFGFMMRPNEFGEPETIPRFNGATTMLAGFTGVAIFFSEPIAASTFVLFMLGDASAALIGRKWGHHRYGRRGKSWEGTGAFVATGLLVSLWIPWLAYPMLAFGAICLAATEAFAPPLYDNVIVPFVGATLLFLMIQIF